MASYSSPLRTAFAGLITMAAVMGVGRFAYTPILPDMAEAVALSKSQAGAIAAANFLGYLVGSLAAGSKFLKGNRRTWMLSMLALSAATTGAMAMTISVSAYLVIRFVAGSCSALVMVFGSAIVLDRLTSMGRPNLTHLHFAGVGTGMAVSAVIVAGLGTYSIGWASQWLACALASLIAFVLVIVMLPPNHGDTSLPMVGTTTKLDRRMIPLSLSYGLFGFGYVITATFISALVRQTPSIAAVEPVIWLIVGLAAIPSVAVWGWIGRRLGNPASMALACVFEAAGVAATVLFDSTAAVLIGGTLLGGTFMGITALGMMTARELAMREDGGDPRRMLGLIVAAFGTGQIIGPAYGGYIANITGSYTVPSLTASFALVLAAGLALFVKADRSSA
ncbi:MAG: YbfB/YjiJ family MFS transporter [Pseudomonadota bacterium]|nr:YbfB/YjiJ family MFS transporter [Pseudomonadota bacterium]